VGEGAGGPGLAGLRVARLDCHTELHSWALAWALPWAPSYPYGPWKRGWSQGPNLEGLGLNAWGVPRRGRLHMRAAYSSQEHT